jgi:hypothetical protein
MHEPRLFSTPEEAALSTFDTRFARVVETTHEGEDSAVVELATNEEPNLYTYFVRCRRLADGWMDAGGHN